MDRLAMHTITCSLHAHLRLLRFRFLRRVHRRGNRVWWSFDRKTVSRGVAVGLFCGVLTPVAQIVFAIPSAIALRANLPAAALSTLAMNPITLPFVYLYAYRIGRLLASQPDAELASDIAASEAATEQLFEISLWPTVLLDWASRIALPFLIGLMLLAFLAAALGYTAVQVTWSVSDAMQRRRRAR
ncbi:MAG TPA: DUF2062 domain-containing protein [Gammaproteobacteria bacterium]|nr:DUF2062 domain-containing protein [Gammaproteobacteria bacterium]